MKLGFFSIMLLVVYIVSGNKLTFISLLASAIHECAHLLAAKSLRIKFDEFSMGVYGARLKVSNNICSYKEEALLCLAGPVANLLCALGVFILDIRNEWFVVFGAFSLGLGVLNLLPVRSFDGGRISEAILLNFLPFDVVKKLLGCSSFLIVFSLWSISVYLLLRYSTSLNLFVFSSYLFCSLFVEFD